MKNMNSSNEAKYNTMINIMDLVSSDTTLTEEAKMDKITDMGIAAKDVLSNMCYQIYINTGNIWKKSSTTREKLGCIDITKASMSLLENWRSQ